MNKAYKKQMYKEYLESRELPEPLDYTVHKHIGGYPKQNGLPKVIWEIPKRVIDAIKSS